METNWFAERPVKDVRPGDHAWLAYSGPEERDLVIGTFVDEGLDTGEKVVYVTENPPETLPGVAARTGPELSTYLTSRQLRVIGHREACLDAHGRFVPEKMAETIDRESGRAFGQGFRAVRITTDHSWLLRGPGRHDFSQMLGCEHRVGDAVAPSTMAMAICQVERRACPPKVLNALRDTHEVLVEVDPEFSDDVLTLVRTFDPPGLRVEGELDSARHTVFTEHLGRAAAGSHTVHLDLSRLAFIDLGGLHLLTMYATASPGGRRLILDGLPFAVEAVIDMVGWHRLPGISRGRRRPRWHATSTERFESTS